MSPAVYVNILQVFRVVDLYPLIEEEFRDMPARFGPAISTDGLKAFVIAGQPKNGCSPLAKRPIHPNFTGKWVVLLARYNCTFEEKVRAAQVAGFDGVIVHNVNSNNLEVMSAKNADNISIPSVFVGEDAGVIIELNYQYNYSYFVVINGDLPFNINHLLMPFSIIVVICLVIMSIFMIVKCVRDRRRARRHRLPNSALKKIPTCKFVKGDPYDMCAICLDDYVEGDKLRVLPCSHAYHCKCIDPWLTKNRRVCPVCKRKVFASGERRSRRNSSSGSDSDDDRDPLLASRTGHNTQGGTFTQPPRNPATDSANETTSGAARQSLSLQGRNPADDGPQRGSWPRTSTRTSAVDYFAKLARLRLGNTRFREEDRQPLTSDDLPTGTSDQLFYEDETPTEASGSTRGSSGSRRKRTRQARQTRRQADRCPETPQPTSTANLNSSNEAALTSSHNNDDASVVSLTDRHSINDGNGDSGDSDSVTYSNVGRIGVAALPNTNNHEPA